MHDVVDRPKKYIVNLNTKMCSCRRFQNDEIPCGHGMTVLRYRRLHETEFCSPFYSLKNFQDAYVIPVEPIPCESPPNLLATVPVTSLSLIAPALSVEISSNLGLFRGVSICFLDMMMNNHEKEWRKFDSGLWVESCGSEEMCGMVSSTEFRQIPVRRANLSDESRQIPYGRANLSEDVESIEGYM
ncbi:hypothetical protein H5410_052818 [Solanum commersonii]|uniref:SWIM-type domain-containing protein n=1 Tax=Solanum commersonii TaxID=4109 RepID=A0A9J5X395_SOLCO|nr:hypothetical protein H5410_052818 [Solanum commersonii]